MEEPIERLPSLFCNTEPTIQEMKLANEDQIKGKAKDIGGKVKEEVGDAIGNDKMKRDGQADQVEGKVKKGVGDAKDKLSD